MNSKTLLEYVIKTIEYDPDGNTYVIERNENGNRRVEIVDEDELISIGKENELTIKIPTKIQTEIQTGFLKQPISPAYDPNNPPVYEPTSPISPAYDPNNPPVYEPTSPVPGSNSDSDSDEDIGFKPKLKILNTVDIKGLKMLSTIESNEGDEEDEDGKKTVGNKSILLDKN